MNTQLLPQLEHETRGKDRVPAQVEEGLVKGHRLSNAREQLPPDVGDGSLGVRALATLTLHTRDLRHALGQHRVGEWQRRLVDLTVWIQRHPGHRHKEGRDGI